MQNSKISPSVLSSENNIESPSWCQLIITVAEGKKSEARIHWSELSNASDGIRPVCKNLFLEFL